MTGDNLVAQVSGDLELKTHGEPAPVREMHRKNLTKHMELERKEGMAIAFNTLGNHYKERGELMRAEAMYKKSLAINKGLGLKEEMLSNYANLLNIYRTSGDFVRAEEAYRSGLAINAELVHEMGLVGVGSKAYVPPYVAPSMKSYEGIHVEPSMKEFMAPPKASVR